MPDSKLGVLARFSSRQRRETDRFDVLVLSPSVESFDPERLPFELRFVFKALPGSEDQIRALIERGYGIGIRTVRRTPEAVRLAVERISEGSQAGVIEPWLTNLVFRGDVPLFTEDELYVQNERGINLFTEAHTIIGERFEMKRLVLVDLEAYGIDEADREFLSNVNQALQPVSAAFLHHRIRADRRPVRIRLARALVTASVFIGPVAHALEGWVRGMGFVFAAVAAEATYEIAELVTLKGSGYTGRQLWKQSRIFLPLIIVAGWLALQAEALIELGSFFVAGCLFGLAAVSFSLLRMLRTFAHFRASYADLGKASKLPAGHLPSFSVFSFREMRASSDRFGMLIGALVAPVLTGCLFMALPDLVRNGWFLAFAASLETMASFLYRKSVQLFDREIFINQVNK